MKKLQTINVLAVFAVVTVLSSCASLGRMAKKGEDVKYKVTPNPLEMHGEKVALGVQGAFPVKYFAKKVTAEITPVLVYNGGEKAFQTISVQGEKAVGNNKVIRLKEGGKFTYNDTISFEAGMKSGVLELRIKGSQGSKTKNFPVQEIAIGTVVTPLLMQNDDIALIGADQFARVVPHQLPVQINYSQNSASVRGKELTDADFKEFKKFAKEARKSDNIEVKNVSVVAYASPEGELRLNENLALDRTKSAKGAISRVLRANRIADKAEDFYQRNAKGEDWFGFKEEMEKSNIEDKELILRILTMYTDLKKREAEIRNLSKTYVEVAEKILPKLRRSETSVNYVVVGKTDEEILSIARTNPIDLNVEELLYAATLTKDENEQMEFYKTSETQFATDYRGSNNVGALYFQQGKQDEAKMQFMKAKAIEENAVTMTNVAVIARLDGDREAALSLLDRSGASYTQTLYNKGLVLLQEGRYNEAISDMGSFNSFNLALAQLLNKQYADAKETVAKLDETAETLYLSAIISARENNTSEMADFLKKAIAKDASLKQQAKDDKEFHWFAETEAFKAAIQ